MNEVSPTPAPAGRAEIDQFSVFFEDRSPLYVQTDASMLDAVRENCAYDSTGRVLIDLDVCHDGSYVFVEDEDSNPLDVLIRSREALDVAILHLSQLGANGRGTCSSLGDTGRCRAKYGHESDHRYPTEEQMQASIDAQLARAAARRLKSA